MNQTHKHTIGQCRCGAYLCCQSNGGDYEGPTYWQGGDLYCQHSIEGCEFKDDDKEEIKNYTLRNLAMRHITMEDIAHAAGLRKGVK